MDVKTIPLRVKSAGPDDGLKDGEFLGYASVFGNVDSGGDMVVKGAFEHSLKDWQASGDALPILWGHDMSDPFANIGAAVEAKEDDHGLLIKGQLDLDNPMAVQVYRLLKGRRVNQMSFAYDVTDGSYVGQKDGQGEPYYEIRGAKIYEVSVVPIGMNQATTIEAVKAAPRAVEVQLRAKGVDELLAAHKTLADAVAAFGEALEALSFDGDAGQNNDDESKASADAPDKPEDRDSGKGEDPAVEVPVEPEASEDDQEDDESLLVEAEALALGAPTDPEQEHIA